MMGIKTEKKLELLKKRQVIIKDEVTANLGAFLIGTVYRSPAMRRYSLTTKVKGKTVSLYVRKDIEKKALQMSERYRKLWADIQELSKLNWEILKLENE